MVLINNKNNLEKRRSLRRNQTPEEDLLWQELRKNRTGLKWRRQVSIGSYVADFYCYKLKLVIELDGGQHLTEKNLEYDQIRDKFFESKSIIVVRINNQKIRSAETLSTLVERVVCAADRVRADGRGLPKPYNIWYQ